MKKQSKLLIGITVGILLIAVIIIVTVLIASGSNDRKYAKHMETAQRYMDELQYEQAIAEYRAAIEIEPNNAEAYRALAEVYVQTGDYESAIAVLEQGIEQTGSEELSEYIEEVRAMTEAQATAAEEQAAQEEQPDLEESEEPVGESGPREETKYLDDGSYVVSEYDINGNLVKAARYHADGTLEFYGVYEYDANGNLVTYTGYLADGTLHSVSEYDANGLVKDARYADGTLNFYSVYEYDGNGNLVKATTYDADGTVSMIQEYDANGNLIE